MLPHELSAALSACPDTFAVRHDCLVFPGFSGNQAGMPAEALALWAADKGRKGQSLSSYSALMAEYRGRMGMDRESRSSSLSILAENPSVGLCPCAPCMLT